MCPGGAGRGPVYTWDAELRWAPHGSLPGVRGLGQEWAEGEGGLSLWTEAWRFMLCWLVCLPPASNAAACDGRDKPARPRRHGMHWVNGDCCPVSHSWKKTGLF